MKQSIIRSLFSVVLFTTTIAVFSQVNTRLIVKPQIQGIILPHHALADAIIDSSFVRLKSNHQPKTVVIFGTNHYFPLSSTYTTTSAIKAAYNLTEVAVDDAAVSNDHSIQTIVPFVSKYFPNAKIIPILVSAAYQSTDTIRLSSSQFTQAFSGHETLYIASVDFAHNVSVEEGLTKNRESINSISNLNYGEIALYKNDHMDSPLTITTLMQIMEQLDAKSWEIWYSSHSGLIKNTIDLNGTSYVIGTFSKITRR